MNCRVVFMYKTWFTDLSRGVLYRVKSTVCNTCPKFKKKSKWKVKLVLLFQKPILLQGHERSITQIKYNREGDLLFSVAKDTVSCSSLLNMESVWMCLWPLLLHRSPTCGTLWTESGSGPTMDTQELCGVWTATVSSSTCALTVWSCHAALL